MRGCVVALILMTFIVAVVVVNAGYVCRTSEMLSDGLASLPATPVPSETPRDVSGIRQAFERQIPLLEITVPRTETERIRTALLLLEIYAAAGDEVRYAEALYHLRELAEALAQSERLSARSFL